MGAMKDLIIQDLDKLGDSCKYVSKEDVWDIYFELGEDPNIDDAFLETIKRVKLLEDLAFWDIEVMHKDVCWRVKDERIR